MRSSPFATTATLTTALLALAPAATAQISLYTVVDMALRNSHEVKMAVADVDRATAGLSQARSAYIPSMSIGSSLGYSYGFPVGQPSIYNVTANSLLLSFSQPELIRSARASVDAARATLHDTREKVVADAAATYAELATDQREIAALDQQHSFGDRLVEIERERNTAGLSSQMDVTQAELISAQLELRRIHIQDHMRVLQLHLAHLTGLSEDAITPDAATIPGTPPLPPSEALAALTERTDAVRAARAEAFSKRYVALSDRRRNLHPEIAFGIQYSRYAKFNNYAEYYLRFQHNNFDVGINMSLPLYDSSARAKSRGSAADAVHAEQQATMVALQLDEQARELTGSMAELRAQQKVAGLQSELAQENVDVVRTQIENGSGNPNVTPMTPRDEQKAHIEERRRFLDKLDSDFQLLQAQIQLQRVLGTVEDWAMQAPQPRVSHP